VAGLVESKSHDNQICDGNVADVGKCEEYSITASPTSPVSTTGWMVNLMTQKLEDMCRQVISMWVAQPLGPQRRYQFISQEGRQWLSKAFSTCLQPTGSSERRAEVDSLSGRLQLHAGKLQHLNPDFSKDEVNKLQSITTSPMGLPEIKQVVSAWEVLPPPPQPLLRNHRCQLISREGGQWHSRTSPTCLQPTTGSERRAEVDNLSGWLQLHAGKVQRSNPDFSTVEVNKLQDSITASPMGLTTTIESTAGKWYLMTRKSGVIWQVISVWEVSPSAQPFSQGEAPRSLPRP